MKTPTALSLIEALSDFLDIGKIHDHLSSWWTSYRTQIDHLLTPHGDHIQDFRLGKFRMGKNTILLPQNLHNDVKTDVGKKIFADYYNTVIKNQDTK